jgi:hypothetical protein
MLTGECDRLCEDRGISASERSIEPVIATLSSRHGSENDAPTLPFVRFAHQRN